MSHCKDSLSVSKKKLESNKECSLNYSVAKILYQYEIVAVIKFITFMRFETVNCYKLVEN